MEQKLFYCYSERLKRALDANGFTPVFVGYTLQYKMVYVYFGTKELNDYKKYVYQTERDRF